MKGGITLRIVETRIQVRYNETDPQGVVYYANYLVWFDIARINLLRTIGLDTVELESKGYGFAAAEANCRYHAPAHFGEELTVRAWIDEMRRKSLTMAYEVVNCETGVTLATGHTAEVLVRMEKGDFEALEIPVDMRSLLEGAMQGDS